MAELKMTSAGMENEESGMSMVTTLEPSAALMGNASHEPSIMSCAVMDPNLTMEVLTKGLEEEEEPFVDSDVSELQSRRSRKHKRMPDPLKKLIKPELNDLLIHLECNVPETVHILSFIKTLLNWKNKKELKRKGMKYKILVSRDECKEEYALIIAYYTWKTKLYLLNPSYHIICLEWIKSNKTREFPFPKHPDIIPSFWGKTTLNPIHGEIKGTIHAHSHFGVRIFKEAIKYSRYLPIEGVGCEWCLFPQEVASEFLAYFRRMDSTQDHGTAHYSTYPVHIYWMHKEDITSTDFEIPRDLKMCNLEDKHIRTVNHYWFRHYEGSEALVEQMIFNNKSIGGFTYSGYLVGWALQTHYGAMAIPYTTAKFRRRGIGRAVMMSLARKMAESDFHPHIFIHKDDFNMKTFLKNSGFIFVNECYYFYIDPPLIKSPPFPTITLTNLQSSTNTMR